MRNADQPCVNGGVAICITEGELQFYLGLLTNLKSDNLITESARQEAIECLVRVLAQVREVTKSQSPSTPGE